MWARDAAIEIARTNRMTNPFFEAKRQERINKRRRLMGELARIAGRENTYLIVDQGNAVSVEVRYEGKRNYIWNGNFDTFDKALKFIHECLAYETVCDI